VKLLQSILGGQKPLRYLKSAFWLISSKVASMAVSLAAAFYIARSLGPQNFGELNYALSVIGILAIFGSIVSTLYRDIVRSPDKEGVILGTAWLISFSASLVTSTLALFYVFVTPHDQLTIWVIALLCIAQFFTPFSIIQNVFYAKTETKWLSVTNFLAHLTISSLKIITMATGGGVLMLASIMVFEQILNMLIYAFLYTFVHKKSFRAWGVDFQYAKQMLADSIPFVLVAGSMAIAARIDQVFIKIVLDITTVGLYGMAVQMSEIWQFVPGIILTAFFPAIVNAKSNPNTYKKRLGALVGVFLLYGVSISLIISSFAPKIVETIYGEAFLGGVSILQVYVWSLPGMIIGFVVQYFLMNENLRRIQVYTAVIPTILNVVLNIILIPKMGAVGAAWATVISFSLLPFIPLLFRSTRAAFSPRVDKPVIL